ncbi:MAG: bacillithiol biosynthesis cysteine-adding enzyme BshC [Bacteroidota bacterium]|nr:bacillithiol biosynthesis cysteine-adding enzyme BshC [Bacteroidota bacterium]MDW8271593.1 bacillithiol biosynthesis cysteine-adding enzyme BshC [Bacteroidota bacterium]
MIEIPWCRVPGVSSLVCDYTRGDDWLLAQCSGDSSPRAVQAAAIPAIEQTMHPFVTSQQQRTNLERLRQGAPVIIGGQQVGYLGGPLYTWLKIATIVAVARQQNAVPLFWVEDNDHDLAEASQVSVVSNDDRVVRYVCPSAEVYPPQTTVSSCRLGPAVEEHLGQLADLLAGLPFVEETLSLLRTCYAVGRSWSDAFIGVHHHVWKEEGVLFVRSSILRTHGAMQKVLEREIAEPGQLQQAVAQQTRLLVERGYMPQVDAARINLFLHHGNRRFRIYQEDEWHYRIAQQRIKAEELAARMRREPHHFSPTAVLRPLVQDWLFAPMVTIVGPAELQYHLQLRGVYRLWQIPMPTLALRHSVTLVPAAVLRLIEQHGNDIEHFFQPQSAFFAWVARQLDSSGLFSQLDVIRRSQFEYMTELERRAAEYDPSLKKAVGAVAHNIGEQLAKLEQKIRRAVRLRQQQAMMRYQRAHTHLFPNNRLQERTIAPIHILSKIGVEQWRTVFGNLTTQSNCAHYIATPDELLQMAGTQVVLSKLIA